MDTHHRKIDLQSPSDLTYLFNNIKTTAQQKLDLAIPPSAAPEGEDAYRSTVEELVQEVISLLPFSLCPASPKAVLLITHVSIVHSSDAHSRSSIPDTQRS